MNPIGARTTRSVRLLGAALVWLACAAHTGCFLYYDSRWGQAKASQKRVAAHEMPGGLRAEPAGSALKRSDQPAKPVEHFRIRAYATPHYAAALVDGEAQFAQAPECELTPDPSTLAVVGAAARSLPPCSNPCGR